MKYITSVKSIEALKAVKELLVEPDHWTQGSEARDANGHRVDADSPVAQCWCLTGAVSKCTGDDLNVRWSCNTILRRTISNDILVMATIEQWNDSFHRKHKDIIELLDKAIANCETTEQNEAYLAGKRA